MQVRDLVIELLKYPMGAEVIMAKNAEGSSHSPAASVGIGQYHAYTTYSGVFFPADEIGQSGKFQPPTDAVQAVRLGPVN